ncbi:flagellar assembly protein FliH [Rhodovulum bhavnagarense]|uniref:Flagellar assembly protein FliH n=1 Tax=Rhodovulum bhavnagarense TaxID=992286 RepID=A0A4R2RPQ8_9RHOB|nr:hypothetical protein [Rhodovulum bhavnagarense]TCP61175.1 flagellar assembly protein FliH [Rhodovulum bhavnagarense]
MRAFPLEDFAARADDEPLPQAEDRLRAYEEGYKAGWDDAAAAEAQAQDHITAEFGKTLGDMAFGYHEARAHIMGGLAPLLSAMVDCVLPTLASKGFARTVADSVLPLARDLADRPLELHVCPENAPALEPLLADMPNLPLTLIRDDSLGPGQALLSTPRQAREIDLDAMLRDLGTALDDFLAPNTEETRRHG